MLYKCALWLLFEGRGLTTFAGVRTRAAASSAEKEAGCCWAAGLLTWAQRITLSEQFARMRLPLRSSLTEMMRGCPGNCMRKITSQHRLYDIKSGGRPVLLQISRLTTAEAKPHSTCVERATLQLCLFQAGNPALLPGPLQHFPV